MILAFLLVCDDRENRMLPGYGLLLIDLAVVLGFALTGLSPWIMIPYTDTFGMSCWACGDLCASETGMFGGGWSVSPEWWDTE